MKEQMNRIAMNCHQVLTGAVNSGDNCYSVGSVEGIPFVAYSSGCNVVILSSSLQRVQIIAGILYGNIQVDCIDSSTDVGKICAAYGHKICVFEPTPLLHQVSAHKLDYKWIQTSCIETDSHISVISWNLEGNKLLTGGQTIRMWHLISHTAPDDNELHIKCDTNHSNTEEGDSSEWLCVWQCTTSTPVHFLRFSPDGTLFVSAGKSDRLVKIWYESAAKSSSLAKTLLERIEENGQHIQQSLNVNNTEMEFSFIYIAHPRAVTGISWRKVSKYLPRGSVANMLVTSCRDNICRLWVQTLLPEDGLVNLSQIEGLSNYVIPRVQTQRHRQKIMQKLKQMKSLSQFKKRQQVTTDETKLNGGPIPTLPSTFSVHDFHTFGIHGTAMAPGLHFHLTASINAETDIPLVPSLSTHSSGADSTTKPTFVIHWLNNKEMFFTQSAEKILQEISLKIIQNETNLAQSDVGSDTGGEADGGDTDETEGASVTTAESNRKFRKPIPQTGIKGSKHLNKAFSHDETEHEDSQPVGSRQSIHTTSSSNSLATELNAANHTNQTQLGDLLDRKLEALIKEWHSHSDLLFSVYPLDGSLLVWLIEWLDESSPSSFRQPQISFSARIPNAIPLGDAATMSHNIALYSPNFYLDLKSALFPNSSSVQSDIESNDTNKSIPLKVESNPISVRTPTVCLLTKHINGSLNLWNLGFGEGSHFTQVVSISHSSRVCGHRFRVNDVTCHPVLPLLLTTSHHNLPGISMTMNGTPNSSLTSSPAVSPTTPDILSKSLGLQNTGFCSELILWRVDSVGPLSKSGGVTELARINSLELSAFSNVAWIPTLLPSTTLGSISNSPSACFVASDGKQLRIYQAVIDARTLLAEVSSAERRNRKRDISPSISDDSTSSEAGQYRHIIRDSFKVVSLQSTARPGCILELNAISDAVHDWKNTQLLHVFQEQLIRGDNSDAYLSWNEKQMNQKGLADSSLDVVVDLRHSAVFEEPFYLVVIEKNESQQSVLHMWRLLIASHSDGTKYSYVPDSHITQDSDHSNASSRSNSPDLSGKQENFNERVSQTQTHSIVSPLKITTQKVCTQALLLPPEVEVIHATPAAGHLSSSNIYPACFAPYLIVTACSDGKIRFWRCNAQTDGTSAAPEYNWVEWEMLLNKEEKSSSFEVPGNPLYVSCAYSGRVACAYKQGQSFSRPNSRNENQRFINVTLAIIECESTGGSEWVLEDNIQLKNIPLPQMDLNLGIELKPLVDTSLTKKRTSNKLVSRLTSGGDEHSTEHRGTSNIQRLLSVPSYTTMQSLKRIIAEKGNQFTLSQKSLVQLDWVSTEDGSHVLTVSAGSKITLFTPVSTDIAQANLQALKTSEKTINTHSNRQLLKQASSMAPLTRCDEIRWMTLRSTDLVTADGLPPLPMQLSWVRDGILVVGMDNEMLIYTQWKSICSTESVDSSVEITDTRILTESELLSHAQESSQLRLPSHPSAIPRSPSMNKFGSGVNNDHKKTTGAQNCQTTTEKKSDKQMSSFSHLPDFGIFEASRLACPVLPQYHPKQLMELLAFGKIYRVRAILGHLVACLLSMRNSLELPQSFGQSFDKKSESERSPRSWLRSRTLSVAAPSSPHQQNSPLDSENFPIIAEEVQLDYTEITSIRPLPLYALIEADDRNEFKSKDKSSDEELDYDNLFDSNFKTQVEETLDEILGRNAFNFNIKPKKSTHTEKNTTIFGQKEARVLTNMLTHSHLPGLSSLDQMHLLALADSVASFNPSPTKCTPFDDSVGRDDSGTESMPISNSIVSADSLDNCGLRFLLTMRQHIYLLRCLPLVQRKFLQKDGLGTNNIVWAFHSETQEELVQLIPTIQKDTASWTELREMGVGLWVRNNALLRKLIERLAKAAFLKNQNPLDAALFYLAMKKKSLVWGLFRSVGDKKMTEFFQNNFNDDKWRKAALKNAYALMGKQRFTHAAAFFLLSGAVWDAVEVCLSKLGDIQLAMVIIRLYEGDIETIPENLKRLLFQEVLGRKRDGSDYRPGEAHPDPFLRSMAYWMLQDYNTALTTLLEIDVGADNPKYSDDIDGEGPNSSPSVFNFYLYLRTQPLIVRRQFAQSIKDKKEQFANSSRGLIQETSYGSDSITPFERRLFFITAHSHFRAGCPSLALEVLSRLPNRIETNDRKESDSFSFDTIEQPSAITTGALSNGNLGESPFDWSAPVTKMGAIDTSDFQFSVEPCSDDEESTGGLEMNLKDVAMDQQMDQNDSKEVKLDIMAQQLKFIACLKILMEELSTLATGFEVDGGQLRYQLYVWLEKSVQALKSICNYRTFSMRHMFDEKQANPSAMISGNSKEISPVMSDRTPRGSHSEGSGITDSKPSLHEILLADKMDFEAKLDRSSRRKLWLTSNEALMRTLLSYCSLHGAHGGGLSSVRMELILLLQELQQERSQQQLLSPLPFPTTLPLLAASVACQKTVVADPIRHLQSVTHDILNTVLDMTSPPLTLSPNYSLIYVLRDLGISLSSCIYQSLCDSDAITSKTGITSKDVLSSSVVCQTTHLLAGHQTVRRNISTASEVNETLTPITLPNKWPGVQSLRALLARDKDEDSPKLHSLLCEAFVAIYLSQLIYSSAACDSYVLYRLIGMDFNDTNWAQLFGGGAKKLIHVATGQSSQTQAPTSQQNNEESESSSLDLLNTLSKQRMKLHMKILQQLSQTDKPIPPPNIKEDRPTYREQFIPPQTSMISYLMAKPILPDELIHIDYDSSESITSEGEDEYKEFDDLTTTDTVFNDGGLTQTGSAVIDEKKLEQELYAWGIIRFCVIKLAKQQLMHFLTVAGIELPDLPTTSPLIYSVLKILNIWDNFMKDYMNEFNGPPQHLLPNTYVEASRQSGPAIHKYKALLEPNNTPFRDHNSISKASKRLWNYLVRQERVQHIFVRFIFAKHKPIATHVSDMEASDMSDHNPESARIVHKDHENISAFCINKTNAGFIAISTPKEIQEIDISLLLDPVPFLEDEAEYDILNLQKAPESLPSVDYLLVQHPADRLQSSPGGLAIQSSVSQNSNVSQTGASNASQTSKNPIMAKHHFPGNTSPQFCQYVLERSRHVLQPLKRHKTEGVRRLCSHPTLPLYLSGSQDGAVTLWEWKHQQFISSPRPAGTFAKVTRVGFNQQGNKFGVTDADGNLSLWQITTNQNKPFFSMQCHSKQASDFTFLGASSLVMTAGQSADHKNIALWDTLLPAKKCLVTSFACHEHNGASAILYAPLNQLLITGGKKGDVFVFDMRQRVQRDRFQAHESAVKCMALDPQEEFFVTGSADGDIKVWGLGSVRVLFYSFPGEHSRSTLFRNIGMGVSHLYVDQNGRLFSCGADGSMKLRQLPDRGINEIINTI